MRSENTQFVGGPLDGRVLPVLVGMLGNPPRVYRIPVPGTDGTPAVEHIYHRAPRPGPRPRRDSRDSRWCYEYDPLGRRPDLPKWPWSRR